MAVFTWQDANQIPHERYVHAETSLRWLREVSDMIRHHEWASYDMTGTHADWHAFLAQHWCGRQIIGLGVLRFEVRLLDKISPFGLRYAFVVRGVDGTDLWILPEQNGNESFGSGRLEEWLPDHTPPARLNYQYEPAAMLADPLPNISRLEVTNFLLDARLQPRASV